MRATAEGPPIINEALALGVQQGARAIAPLRQLGAARAPQGSGRHRCLATGQIGNHAGQLELATLRSQSATAAHRPQLERAIHTPHLVERGVGLFVTISFHDSVQDYPTDGGKQEMADTYRGATALVTGGASGIGAALVRGLAARGAFVAIADRQVEVARAMAETLRRAGAGASAHELDVRDQAAASALVRELWESRDGIDYVFANAGTGVGGEALEYTDDDWRYIVDVNLMGVIHLFHAAYPRMAARRSGHLIATASMAGLLPAPLSTVYGATKHGVVGLCRSLRIEAAEHGVRVTVLCPGVIRTAILVNAGMYGRVTRTVTADAQTGEFEKLRPMDPDRFASVVLARLPADPRIVIAPAWWRILWWLDRLSPRLGDAVMRRPYRVWREQWSAGEVAPKRD